MWVFVPLGLALLLLAALAVTTVSSWLDRIATRLSWALFGRLEFDDRRRERSLRGAGIGTPYRVYAAKTNLFTLVGALSGAVLGIYVGAAVISVVETTEAGTSLVETAAGVVPDWAASAEPGYFTVLVLASALFGLLTAALMYAIRWQVPSIRANTRQRQIEAGMPRTIAFVYALSRGGMAFPDVMRTLDRNRGVFGTAADEMGVGVRNIDLFGDDLVTAVRDLAQRTPSDQFQKFTENLSSVLQSGQDLSTFLRDEYERYSEAAEDQQRRILDLLATTAEVYVTVVVAGMLFLLTILLIIGLTSGGMLLVLQILTYAVLPATNVLFIAYLTEITQPLRASKDTLEEETPGAGDRPGDGVEPVRADGAGVLSERSLRNRDRLHAYRRLKGLLSTLSNPFEALISEPTLLLYATVPLAVGFVAVRVQAMLSAGAFSVGAFDDVLVQATLFVLGTFAVVYEIQRRRLERLEDAVPDLLERLASLNEAGVAVVSSFDRVRESDVGALDEEVERIWRDIQWGATVTDALERFESRVRTPSVTRTVTLITNALRASNEIGPVLRIAAEQARNDRRLKEQRNQEMFTYVLVIYVAFLVFLVVIAAINFILIPALPTGGSGLGASVPGSITVSEAEIRAYRLAFFHAGLVQAMLSGLVGGQMSGGSIKDGAKHASILLGVAYLALLYAQSVSATAAPLALLPL
ncbi:type II secretion system F family protein [Halorarius halobius]|uniref:type II secretion system F family protein n=1 Tax=Halorarius halobius TaxID=2962671 RepID=UPI0020CCE866|nr:type II secretion system F family protein [Halorarius halobius]